MSSFKESIHIAIEPLRFAAEKKAEQQMSRYPAGYEPYKPQELERRNNDADEDIVTLGKATAITGLGIAGVAAAVEQVIDVSDTLAASSFAAGLAGVAIGGFIYAYGKVR